MDATDQLPDKHLKIFQTLCDMLRDRGYIFDGKTIALLERKDPNEIRRYFEETEPLMQVTHKDRIETLIVLVSRHDKTPKAEVVQFREMLKEYKTDFIRAIVVSKVATPQAADILNHSPNFQHFTEKEVLFNVTKHSIVPKHTALTTEETEQVKKMHPGGKFPSLFTTDPVCKYYNWPVGTLVRIERKFGQAQEPRSYYRIVTLPE